MKKDSHPIVVEQLLNAPIQTVWNAITNLDEMKRWYFSNIPNFEAKVGFETAFEMYSDTRTFHAKWKVVDVEPNDSIQCEWSYKNIDGVGKVTFNLKEDEDNNKTWIQVVNEGLDSFPQDIPEFKPESCQGGWEYFIKGNLVKYINTETKVAS